MAHDKGLLIEKGVQASHIAIEVANHSSTRVRELLLHCLWFKSGSRAKNP